MATNDSIEQPGYPEIAITLFCWWESVSAAPHVLMTLFARTLSSTFKNALLSYVNSPEFWAMAPFALVTGFTLFFFLLRKKRSLPPQPNPKDPFAVARAKHETRARIIRELERANRRTKILRALRSFGLSLLKDWLLDRMGVSLYGTFNRPSTWEDAEGRANKVDRITFKDGSGREYQYSTKTRDLIVREHPAETDKYGTEKIRSPNREDIRLLLLASSYFPWWSIKRNL